MPSVTPRDQPALPLTTNPTRPTASAHRAGFSYAHLYPFFPACYDGGTPMDTIIIFGAKYLIFITVALAAAIFFTLSRENQKKLILLASISLPLTYLLALLARYLYENPRPFVVEHFTPLITHAADNGFPSDHALLLAAIASVFHPFTRRGSYALWILTLAVGASRVYAGVHHPIDIIGSIGIALAVTSLVHRALTKRIVRYARHT